MKEMMKKLMEVFLTCQFLISLAIGICGLVLEPGGVLGIDWVRGCMEAEDLKRRLAQLQKGK